jgi:hypothetical protein
MHSRDLPEAAVSGVVVDSRRAAVILAIEPVARTLIETIPRGQAGLVVLTINAGGRVALVADLTEVAADLGLHGKKATIPVMVNVASAESAEDEASVARMLLRMIGLIGAVLRMNRGLRPSKTIVFA